MAKVELVHWNPRRRVIPGRINKIVRLTRPVNNFGDLLGPLIALELLKRSGIKNHHAIPGSRLLSVGSILQLARTGDTVWGTGANGKSLGVPLSASSLDIRAVRGPLTRLYLAQRGFTAPEVYGDPGLLIGTLFPKSKFARNTAARDVLVMPNLNDLSTYSLKDKRVHSPTAPLQSCLTAIASSSFVTGSSLHAIIIAESYGIPARLIASDSEPDFKYQDYYRGSGRDGYTPAKNVAEALEMGGENPPEWDYRPLLRAFPIDLWRSSGTTNRNAT